MKEQLKKQIEEFNAQIEELNAQIRVLSEKQYSLRQQLAEMQTDIKVGDHITIS